MAGVTIGLSTIASEEEFRQRAEELLVVDQFLMNDQQFRMEFVAIPSGRFNMGSPDSEPERGESEGPVHEVRLQSFTLGRYPVTQAQWQAVMGEYPNELKKANCPVVNISWNDVQEFLRQLNWAAKDVQYRLPSEAEWEYACRAGTTTPFWCGTTLTTDQANYDGNFPYGDDQKGEYRGETTPVGMFPANPWGLYDMHGNVWEWCQDLWNSDYEGLPTDGSAWEPKKIAGRVMRGGYWHSSACRCRSACRRGRAPGRRFSYTGFRLVRLRGQ